MILPEWQGRQIIIFSRRVHQELAEIGIDLWGVEYILEFGFDCTRSKRKRDVVEKCIRSGEKVIKVVVQKSETMMYNEVWILRHVGIIGLRKEWRRL